MYLGSFAEEDEDEEAGEGLGPASARPQPCALPLTGVAFVSPTANYEEGGQQGLFVLLGETDTVMYTTLPAQLPEDEEDGEKDPSTSRRYAYGSPLLALRAHKARVLALAVDSTASVLASGDASGHLRVWKLNSTEGAGAAGAAAAGGAGAGGPGGGAVVDVAQAHTGPILALAHGEGELTGFGLA